MGSLAAQTAAMVSGRQCQPRQLAVGAGGQAGCSRRLPLAQSRNLALAAAQNIGIEWARERGFGHVLLLDQDSEPGEGMVAALLGALRELSAVGPVAAVGPALRRHPRGHIAMRRSCASVFHSIASSWCDGSTPTIACDFLIKLGHVDSAGRARPGRRDGYRSVHRQCRSGVELPRAGAGLHPAWRVRGNVDTASATPAVPCRSGWVRWWCTGRCACTT
ncbi:hypothetical protein RLIN73S_04777 [Rhodanobacter lindaniclasticus]